MTNLSLALSLLSDNQTLEISPNGYSMCPFFLGGRDTVYITQPSFPLKRGDIAVYKRNLAEDERYIIHRIHHLEQTTTGTLYYMLGDNQIQIEGPINESQIHGIALQIKRKGKLIDCKTNHFYRFTSKLWLLIRPIRPIFIRIWLTFMPSIHRMQRADILKNARKK